MQDASYTSLFIIIFIFINTKYTYTGNRWQIDTPFCHKQGMNKLNLDCYYEPWTNCTIQDALGNDGTVYNLLTKNNSYLHPNGFNSEVYDTKYKNEKAIIVELDSDFDWDYPKQFEILRRCSPFPDNKLKYWWRAVSITYLMRLNEPTKRLIQHFKTNNHHHHHNNNYNTMYFNQDKEQCISLYVRRGDKELEMYLMKNDTIFFETAKELWNNLTPRLNNNQQQPIMFVGSEDANLIDNAIKWGIINNWKILYTNLFDRRQVISGLNTSERIEWVKTHPNRNHHLEYFSMILNLDLHLQCDAFICSMPSNFCRLIDELKATIGAKANTPLADFHDGSGVPCYTSDCITVGW